MPFEDTHWTLVLRAGLTSESSREALESLCATYWQPLYVFLRKRGIPHEDALDLLQEFFVEIFEKEMIKNADPERGRFRTFLLTALTRFVTKERAKARAKKRGGGVRFVFLDQPPPSRTTELVDPGMSPEQAYQRRWALDVLAQAIVRLRASYEKRGHLELFDALQPTLSNPGAVLDYAAVAAQLEIAETTLRVAAYRMRRRFGVEIRRVISRTVTTDEEVEAEIAELLDALRDHPPHGR